MNEFIKDLKKFEKELKQKAARIIGTESINHFRENFEKQSFDGKKWKDVKRRDSNSEWYGFKYDAKSKIPNNHPRRKGAKKPYKKRKSSPITNFSPTATKTPVLSSQKSELENSLVFKVKNSNTIIITSDKPYSNIHNEGGKIKVFGRKSAKVPKRQYVGASKVLDKKIEKAVFQKIKI